MAVVLIIIESSNIFIYGEKMIAPNLFYILIYFFIIFIVLSIIFLLIINRNPERYIPKGDNIVSPADGEVIEIIDLSRLDHTRVKDQDIRIKKGINSKILTSAKEVGRTGKEFPFVSG